ncbi:MAG: hypothetical protein WCT18_03305 [Patescibacteria group bacterium]
MDENKKTIIPKEINELLATEASSEINMTVARENQLTIGQLAGLTLLLSEVFEKKIGLENLFSEIKKRLPANDELAKKICLEVCGRKLLAFSEYFSNKVEAVLVSVGGAVDFYQPLADKFLQQAQKEVREDQQKKLREIEEEKELLVVPQTDRQKENMDEYLEKKLTENQAVFLEKLDEEKQSAKRVFGGMLLEILEIENYRLKLDLNIRMFGVLFEDEEQKVFQKELLDVLYKNNERLTDKKITVNSESVDPTIGNWLADFIHYAGIEETNSTIKRSQYLISSPNVKSLSAEEKSRLDNLLKIFVALKNFYSNAEKMDMADLYIFPYNEEDYAELMKYLQEQASEFKEQENSFDNQISKSGEAKTTKPIDLTKVLAEDSAERQKIDQEKKSLFLATRGELMPVAEYFEEALLRRKRYQVLAGLEVLCEQGILDDLVFADVRFSKLLEGYYLRNNLQDKKQAFSANQKEAVYIQDFLKFIFLERLGLPEILGAKMALNLGNIMRSVGLIQYSQLAYFDLSDNQFKWS